jgi:hypothetical protein
MGKKCMLVNSSMNGGGVECVFDPEQETLALDGLAHGYIKEGWENGDILFEETARELFGDEYEEFCAIAQEVNRGEEHPIVLALVKDTVYGYYDVHIECGSLSWGCDIYEEM